MEEKVNSVNVQLCSVTPEKGFRIYSEDEVNEIINTL